MFSSPRRQRQTRSRGVDRAAGANPPQDGLALAISRRNLKGMFTIEHEFDATVITLVDEGASHLHEDIVINAFEECITIEQFDTRLDRMQKITLSMVQLRDLAAALNLPEGVYHLRRET